MEPRKRRKRKKINKKKWISITLLILLLLAGAGYLFRKELSLLAFNTLLKKDVQVSLTKSYTPLPSDEEQIEEPPIVKNEPFSVLLLGTDQRDQEPGRSDTIIYSVIRPEDNKILLVSIPRDSYTEIIGRANKSKINSAYAHGGAKMSIDTVENLLQNKVDYFGAINFNGIKDIVDAVGGVKLPITKVIENKSPIHEKLRIEPNKPIYHGQDALSYVRYREDSDFKRTERQRIFIKAMIGKTIELKNIRKIPELIDIAGSNFKTNMPPDTVLELAETIYMNDTLPDFESHMLQGKDMMIGNGYYYDIDPNDLKFTQNLIANWLNNDISNEELIHPKEPN